MLNIFIAFYGCFFCLVNLERIQEELMLIKLFQANVSFLYPLNISENLWFLIFRGGLEMEPCTEIGQFNVFVSTFELGFNFWEESQQT